MSSATTFNGLKRNRPIALAVALTAFLWMIGCAPASTPAPRTPSDARPPVVSALPRHTPAPTERLETIEWQAVFPPRLSMTSRGVKTYLPRRDIVVERATALDGETWWQKSLLLDESIVLSLASYRKPDLSGFGISIQVLPDDAWRQYSWEWFDRVGSDRFAKRQGSGSVTVQFVRSEQGEEIAAITFLSDVTLRLVRLASPLADGEPVPPPTHTVTIAAGSVFRVMP